MKSSHSVFSLLLSVLALAVWAYPGPGLGSTKVHYGEPVNMGNGTIRTYLALMNGNGRIDGSSECEGDFEFALALPSAVAGRSDIPFRWVAVNWNGEGHEPHGVYDLPHFDFHFYIASEESVRKIGVGSCAFFIDCADFERATRPVPAKYVHDHHVNVNAAVAAMGNHLIDTTSPEFADPPRKFTHTWIFGAYDGSITFYEPMITHEFLMTRRNICVPIKQPQAWQIAGYYPSRYCIRYHDSANKYTVSLEGLEYRKAE
jgi:hypothetical protein